MEIRSHAIEFTGRFSRFRCNILLLWLLTHRLKFDNMFRLLVDRRPMSISIENKWVVGNASVATKYTSTEAHLDRFWSVCTVWPEIVLELGNRLTYWVTYFTAVGATLICKYLLTAYTSHMSYAMQYELSLLFLPNVYEHSLLILNLRSTKLSLNLFLSIEMLVARH